MPNTLKDVEIKKFTTEVFKQWDVDWLLLSCGSFGENKFNSMTVAWGGFGVMWNLPIAMIVVRPSRYTFEFLNAYETFSLCSFPKKYKRALSLLGTKSGRDGDKISESGLTAIAAERISAPIFQEANLALMCRKLYFQDFDPCNFLDDRIEKQYGGSDYHRMVFGEVLAIKTSGESK